MKIGIVTITETDNFGNRLQNYALQQVLIELGHTVETIPNLIIYQKNKKLWYKALLRIYGIYRYILWKDREILSSIEKQKRLKKYNAQYLSFSAKESTMKHIPEHLDEEYDVFVAGSDQIWNTYFLFDFEFNFLRFAQRYKRVAYAASFGSDHIKEEYVDQFTKYLSEMSYISVREIVGKRIVESLTDKTATVVLDPTMLLDAKQWALMEKKPYWSIDGDFVLVYYLGEKKGRQDLFEQFYRENPSYRSYKIVDIYDPSIKEQYAITPDEFIWLIHHAALVMTDSFHGTIFSILFGTPFWSAKRLTHGASMQSRQESLFEILDVKTSGLITDVKEQPGVYLKLEEYRRISLDYLKAALNDVEKTGREHAVVKNECHDQIRTPM